MFSNCTRVTGAHVYSTSIVFALFLSLDPYFRSDCFYLSDHNPTYKSAKLRIAKQRKTRFFFEHSDSVVTTVPSIDSDRSLKPQSTTSSQPAQHNSCHLFQRPHTPEHIGQAHSSTTLCQLKTAATDHHSTTDPHRTDIRKRRRAWPEES